MPEPIIYLDHAATSWPKPPEVGAEMLRALRGPLGNAGRSAHRAALEAARTIFEARRRLAELFGVAAPENLVFVRGCTEGLNLVLKGWLKPGDRVAVSPMEHNSVMRPLTRLVREQRIAVETLPADPFGRLDLEATRRMVRAVRPSLAVVAHASNVNGAVQDLGGLRHALDQTPLLVDAAQTAGVLPLQVEALGIDFLACSAHKGLLGPTGVGLCYLAPHRQVRPLLEGGTGSRSESFEQPPFRPDAYEAGTLNLHGIAGTYGALLGLGQRGLLGEHQRRLAQMLVEGLGKIAAVAVHSPSDDSALCVCFTAADKSPDELAARLESRFGILCRAGLHCAPAAHRHLGTFPTGAVRLAPGWGNTPEDIEATLRAVYAVVQS